MPKKRIILLVGAILVVAATVWLRWRVNPLPALAQITGMKVRALNSTGSVVKQVPTDQIGPILKLFGDSRLDLIPMKWVAAYGIEIETAGQKIPVEVFFTHGGAGAFRVNGRYFRGGTDKAFEDGIGGLLR